MLQGGADVLVTGFSPWLEKPLTCENAPRTTRCATKSALSWEYSPARPVPAELLQACRCSFKSRSRGRSRRKVGRLSETTPEEAAMTGRDLMEALKRLTFDELKLQVVIEDS